MRSVKLQKTTDPKAKLAIHTKRETTPRRIFASGAVRIHTAYIVPPDRTTTTKLRRMTATDLEVMNPNYSRRLTTDTASESSSLFTFSKSLIEPTSAQ